MKLLNYKLNDIEVEVDSGTPQNKKIDSNLENFALPLFEMTKKKEKKYPAIAQQNKYLDLSCDLRIFLLAKAFVQLDPKR